MSTQAGKVYWLTGLSGAGKTTLAQALRARLADERTVEILDGDEVRTYLSKGLGFSREDRDTNIQRIGYVARLLARNGVAVVAAAISPPSDGTRSCCTTASFGSPGLSPSARRTALASTTDTQPALKRRSKLLDST